MKVYRNIQELQKEPVSRLVNIGNYDGVHLGHQDLIKYLKNEALEQESKLCLYTFDPHPRVAFEGIENFLLMNIKRKIESLERLGVDELFILDFNAIAELTANEFLQTYIQDIPNIQALYLGYDFRYGKDKKGDFISTNNFFKDSAMILKKAPSFARKNITISSSLIRDHLAMGEIEETNSLLGSTFLLEGLVVPGKGKGKQIGIPTANLNIDPLFLVPQKGVYCTSINIDGKQYPSITNVGVNPTFGTLNKSSIETHIFDYDENIYDKEISLSFYKYLRREQKFSAVDDLVKQINVDIKTARNYWKI